MIRKAIVLGILAFLTFASLTHADWIKGIFSEEAGIDSLERFLVIRDIDSCRIFGRPILPLGDIDGDGCSDVILAHMPKSNCLDSNISYLYYGGCPPDGVPKKTFYRIKYTATELGDINGDGFTDLGVSQCYPNRMEIWLGGALLHDTADYLIPDTYSWLTRAADLDDDGFIELPLSISVGGGYVNIFQVGPNGVDTIPKYVIPDTSMGFGGNLATGDFNGDGYPDLAVAAYLNRDSSFVKFYWGGPGFDTIPDFEIWRKAERFGMILLPLGDFNGDGYEDILIDGGVANGWSIPCGVFFGGPNIDNTLDIVTNRFTYGGYLTPTWVASAGDVNHDGYPDLITGLDFDTGFLYEAKIFLGGPKADSIPEIYLENGLIPGGQRNFAAVVAGVGDFNGDGIDDFAVRSVTSGGCCWWGEVNFFAGWDSDGSDVAYEFEPTYPKIFDLKQNYPNPFNPSTTIEFDLPRHSHAKLVVYNLLGAQVATLLDRDLPAGLHRVIWDGVDTDGRIVTTGVYLYRIVTDGYSQTRKMVLMK